LARHPQLFDPAQGWIATANHNILPPGFRDALGYEFAQPYRYQRIAEVLPATAKHRIEDSMRLQQDIVSVAGRRFREAVERAAPQLRGRAGELARRLRGWDARMEKGSAAAAVFAVWFEETGTAAPGAELLNRTAEDAWEVMEELLGPDAAQWTWGGMHKVVLDRPYATGGHATTVNAAGGASFRHTSGASYRQIFDLADWDRAVVSNVPGESGDAASAHAFDLVEDWLQGRYHPLPYTRRAVEAAAGERLRLTPGR
jgi:penicillin amidase